jgi:hypothetical protein
LASVRKFTKAIFLIKNYLNVFFRADYCSPGTVSLVDLRCTSSVYLNINNSVPDGINLIPLLIIPAFNPP